jgi:uncharacterized protein
MKLYRKPKPKRMQIPSGFATNLGQLLLAPLGEKGFWLLILGFVLVVCMLGWKRDLLYNETIYPCSTKETMAMKKYVRWWIRIKLTFNSKRNRISRNRVFLKKIAFDKPIQIFIVSVELQCIQHLKLREEFQIMM